MITPLSNSEKYQADILTWKEKISNLNTEEAKQKCNKLLEDLQKKVDLIDQMHSTSRGYSNLKDGNEIIRETVQLRFKLSQLLK